mmetsp:Transcript_23598/g.41778  ORF Transcript_23598/g.41778 Transcript_23598/m.41778 type:complete len:470 (+) Transcript_23598:375-1784(+)
MIRMQRENSVHCAAQDRVHLVILGRDGKAHAQEVRGIVQIVARIDKGLPDGELVGPGCNCRHLGNQADRGDLALVRIGDVGAVVVEGRHGPHDAGHDRHRVGVTAEPTIEIDHLLVQHGVVGHEAFELFQLGRRGQRTIKQQIAYFEVVRFLGQLVDGIATVQQHPFAAIDECDRAVAACRRGKAGVVGEHTRLAIEFADVQNVWTGRGRMDWQVVTFVANRQFCVLGCISHRSCSFRHRRRRSPRVTTFASGSIIRLRACCDRYTRQAAASSSLARVSWRPRTSIMSKTEGVTARPASAARSGPASLPNLVSCSAANAFRIASRLSRSQVTVCRCGVNCFSIPRDTGSSAFAALSSGVIGRSVRINCALSRSSGNVLDRSLTKGSASISPFCCKSFSAGRSAAARKSRISRCNAASSACAICCPHRFSSFLTSKRAGLLPIPLRSNQSCACASVKNSSSPWLQPSRAR